MPVKKDAYGRRWIEVEFVVPGTAEQVWRAVATGPGLSAWFAKTTLEEKVGGALLFEMGPGMSSKGIVNVWEPPHRLAYEEPDWMEGAPSCATEVLVSERHGGSCLFFMSHSLFWPDEKWDDMLESFEKGWYSFVEVLRLYLGKFGGGPAAATSLAAMHPGGQASAWKMLTEALGFAGADVGESRRAPDSTPGLAGTVHRIVQSAESREMLIKLEEPAGAALLATYSWGEGHRVSLNIYRYGDQAADQAAQDDGAWKAWMEKLFPSAAEAGEKA